MSIIAFFFVFEIYKLLKLRLLIAWKYYYLINIKFNNFTKIFLLFVKLHPLIANSYRL